MQLHTYILVGLWILNRRFATCKTIQKRQLYREQVSPHLGGKIPDTAFHSDRLALNQLQKVGIAIPDGVVLEQRNPEVYQYSHKTKRPVYKVPITNDHRYTVNEGRYKSTASFETTYLIPQIVQSKEHDLINVIRPTKKKLILPNSNRKDYSRISTNNNVQIHPRAHQTVDIFSYWPYQSYNFGLNFDYQHNFYETIDGENYIGSNIFSDLTNFFDIYVHHQ